MISEDDMNALIVAHWNEFQFEEIIRRQGDDITPKADDIGQVQLAINKLERAKMEVTCYTDVVRNLARTLCSWWVRSGSPTLKAILISRQMRLWNRADRRPEASTLCTYNATDPCWRGPQFLWPTNIYFFRCSTLYSISPRL